MRKFFYATIFTGMVATVALAPMVLLGAELEVSYPSLGDGVTPGGGPAQWVQYLFLFGVAISSIAAVGSLIWAGILWMTAHSQSNVKKARDRIQGALLGILIIAGSVLILQTINPDLVSLENPNVDQSLFQQEAPKFGEFCEKNEDCENTEEYYCNQTLGKCLYKKTGEGAVGDDCSSDPNACGGNLYCAQGETCQQKKSDFTPCSSPAECQSGKCQEEIPGEGEICIP